MELYTLSGGKYYITNVVEGYSSLIWTERYREPGDFELRFDVTSDAEDPDYSLGLSRGTLLGLRESDECMIVEERAIDVDEDGSASIVYKGRTFETILENRIARPALAQTIDGVTRYLKPKPLNIKDKDQTDDWKFTGWSSARIADTLVQYYTNSAVVQDAGLMSLQRINNYDCGYGNLDAVLPQRTVVIQPGTIYQRVIELLEMDDLGIRNRRPRDSNGVEYLFSIIYQGVDRSSTVALLSSAGHFRKEKYLENSKDVYDQVFEFSYWDSYVRYKYSSFDQFSRVGYLDSTDQKVLSTAGGTALNEQTAILADRAEGFLNAHKPRTLFQCEVAWDIPYVYGRDYSVGDILFVQGHFRFEDKMRVTEFVRIEDEEGERSYPTLEQIAPIAPTI